MHHQVVIVGAGPGGAAAALALAQRGLKDVLLLDRDPFPRDKTCGSGLSPNALKVLDGLGPGEEVRATPSSTRTGSGTAPRPARSTWVRPHA